MRGTAIGSVDTRAESDPAREHNDQATRRVPLRGVAWVFIAAAFLAIYGRDAGLGFISDDFAWIAHGRIHDRGSVTRIFSTSIGFYRPLTSLSFGVDHARFDMNPKGYGATNLALALAAAVLLGVLATTIGMSPAVGAIAAALWLFNFHGMNMAVLWLSGRTSLLVTLWSLAAVVALLRGHAIAGASLALLAMLAKEEAVVLPVLLTIWLGVERVLRVQPRRRNASGVLLAWVALAIYLALRSGSGAYWPHSAPAFYSPTLAPGALARNVAEYADRSLTFSLGTLLATAVAVRRWPRVRDRAPAIAFGFLWFVCGFALTVFLPVRSSLYVLYPSAGSCLVAAILIVAMCDRVPAVRLRRLIMLGMLTIAALMPVYWARNARWRDLAQLSTSAIADLQAAADRLPPGTTVAIVDDTSTRTNLTTAWGNMTSEMAALSLDGRLHVSVYQRADAIARDPSTVVVRLENGRLVGW